MKDYQDQSETSTEDSTSQSVQCPVTTQVATPVTPTEVKTETNESTEDKTVEVVSRKDNNSQRLANKSVSKDNVVSVAKAKLSYKQVELTSKIKEKGTALGLSVAITRGRLSNMCNGNCNLTETIEKVCTALLEDAGWTVTEKKANQEVSSSPEVEVAVA